MKYEELYEIIAEEFYAREKVEDNKKDLFEGEIEKVTQEFLNNNIKAVLSLDERSTLVLRKLYGVDSGKKGTLTKVANDLDMSVERVRQIVKKAKYFLYRRILNSIKEKKIERLSSIELSENYEILKDKSLACLGLYSRLFNNFTEIGVYTLGDLLSKHPYELTNNGRYSISIETVNVIKGLLAQMGLKFMDDLTEEEKYTLIGNCSYFKLLNSSAYWISDATRIKGLDRLRTDNNLSLTIKDAIDYINCREIAIPMDTIRDVKKMGFIVSDYVSLISFLTRFVMYEKLTSVVNCDYSIESYLKIGISSYNLQSRTIITLQKNRILTLGDLVKMDKVSLKNIKKLDQKELYEIDRLVHGLGFFFKDEANLLRTYSDTIYTELNNQDVQGRSRKLRIEK